MNAKMTPNKHTIAQTAYRWRDAGWMRYRARAFCRKALAAQPINIYEIHPKTCMLTDGGEPLSCEALARELSSYVKQMGYTHVELVNPEGERTPLPDPAHTASADWMQFVDTMHEAGIGVILDYAPTAQQDAQEQDGEALPTDARISALCKALTDTIQAYHLDGVYFDILPLLSHLDCRDTAAGTHPGTASTPDRAEPRSSADGATPRRRASELLQALTAALERRFSDLITIIDDSALSLTDIDGKRFSLRRDNGWTEDTLAYFQKDPLWRKYDHEKIVLPLSYAFGASYLLAVSHKEVSVGRCSLPERMPGDYAQKFANVRLLLAHMILRPGKKQLFMGCEIGSFREWSPERPIEWFLTDHRMHEALQRYCAELNHFYLEQPPLWEQDSSREGFAWIDPSNAEESVLSFCRFAKDGSALIAVFNLTPVARERFLLGVPAGGAYGEVFNSDAARYGGEGRQNAGMFAAIPASLPHHANAIRITLPPLSALVFKQIPLSPPRPVS